MAYLYAMCVRERERKKEKEIECMCVYVCVYIYIYIHIYVYVHVAVLMERYPLYLHLYQMSPSARVLSLPEKSFSSKTHLYKIKILIYHLPHRTQFRASKESRVA